MFLSELLHLLNSVDLYLLHPCLPTQDECLKLLLVLIINLDVFSAVFVDERFLQTSFGTFPNPLDLEKTLLSHIIVSACLTLDPHVVQFLTRVKSKE